MIQRRTLLKSSAAAVAVGAPVLGLAQQAVTLKFHTFMAPLSNVWLNMHKAWMDKVEKDSGGRIKFEAYHSMQLGGTPFQLYDQVKDGVVEIQGDQRARIIAHLEPRYRVKPTGG